jgi:alanine racemase
MGIRRREVLGWLAGSAVAGAGAAHGHEAQQAAAGARSGAAATPRRGDPWIEISAAALEWNLRQIEARAGKAVMAVVKANAYGHGLAGVARVLERAGVRHFLVGNLEEAQELRAAGIRGSILNFGPFAEADAAELIRHRITQNVFTGQVDTLERAAARRGTQAQVAVKVDTGLGRVGVPHQQAAEFLEHAGSLKHVRVTDVFTTLTEDPEFDRVQLARFRELRARVAREAGRFGAWHAASSAAILDLPEAVAEFDRVRPGIMLYGLYPSERAERERKLELKPAMALKARVVQVKAMQPGESVSYHRAYRIERPEAIATIAAGYSDGVPRGLAGKGSVLVGGRRCAIVAITSNATMVRLEGSAAEAGAEAVFLGTQGGESLTAGEVARVTGSSVYALVMGMNARLPRVVV